MLSRGRSCHKLMRQHLHWIVSGIGDSQRADDDTHGHGPNPTQICCGRHVVERGAHASRRAVPSVRHHKLGGGHRGALVLPVQACMEELHNSAHVNPVNIMSSALGRKPAELHLKRGILTPKTTCSYSTLL